MELPDYFGKPSIPNEYDYSDTEGRIEVHIFTKQFFEYCQRSFDLEEYSDYNYQSLSVCIIDCVYSLRAKYQSVTVPIVDRYAALYLNGNRNNPGDTVSMLIQHIEESGGARHFADNVLKNHQKLGGKQKIPKEEICYQLAKYLRYLHIETIEDFRNFESPELLEIVIRAVRGIGDAGANYLFMLAGDPERCKQDVHIHQCIRECCGSDISNKECQVLFSEAVSLLKEKYPDLTVRSLDGIIWRKYQSIQ